MNKYWLQRTGARRLILVFAGWGLGASPFLGLSGTDDVLVVDDYTCLDRALPEWDAYDQRLVLAYSFGVAAAAHWLLRHGLQPDRTVAVAGTLFPVDAQKGIAPRTVQDMADNLSPESFGKFCQRAGMTTLAKCNNIDAARAELQAIIHRGAAPDFRFDRIWIPSNDRIIPTACQRRAWQNQPRETREFVGPHMGFDRHQSWAEWIA